MSDDDYTDDVDDVDGNTITDETDLDDADDADADDDGDDDVDGGGQRTIAEDVLEYLAKSVVSDPDAVNIDVDERGRRIQLTVTVGDGDMGRVIGRRGRIANAIRSIVRAAATRDDVEVEVEFED